MSWRKIASSFLAGACVRMEHDEAEGVYKVILEGPIKTFSDNKFEARMQLALRLEQIAQELRR